jgi:hypothetical protein
MQVQLVMIRHSKSCANHVRALADTEDHDHPLIAASQTLRDPPLSSTGARMAVSYGPTLQAKLERIGIDLSTAIIGSSALSRAKETAALLFPDQADRLRVVPHFTEHGAIPENTPTAGLRHKPDWSAFLKHLATMQARQFVIVGHGSYIKSVTGRGAFKNLEAVLMTGTLSPAGRLTNIIITSIPYIGKVSATTPGDKCSLPAKIAAQVKAMSRKTRKHQSRRRKTRQRGAGYNMPLAYFQNGAQLIGTTADPTGTGIGDSTATWARAPIHQTGGAKQQGGFPPSIMGPFAANGLQYALPMASYSGYKLFTRKNRRSGRA